MTKHQKVTNELMHLIAQHPDRPVMVVVPTEGIVGGCDYDWWVSQFCSVGLDEIYEDQDGQVHMRSDDEDDLIDEWIYDNFEYDDPYSFGHDEEEARQMGQKAVDAYDWKKIIMVKIEAWEG